ncbi:MAG: citryl-CoA lyase, partial [Gammaproteobacteria bacterium]
ALALWWEAGTEGERWRERLAAPPAEPPAWGLADRPPEHPPGFDPRARRCPGTVRRALAALAGLSPGPHLPWLAEHRGLLEELAGAPLAMAGVAAAACRDLGLAPAQGELLHLLLRLPGAAAHALEQSRTGWRGYPFFPGAVRVTGGDSKQGSRGR